MELNEKDRLIIANQLKIIEKLYPEEADYYAKHGKVVEQGYKLHYSWLVEHLYDEMTEDECREVEARARERCWREFSAAD